MSDNNPKPQNQASCITDLQSHVKLVQKYALRDLGNIGDRFAHAEVVKFLHEQDDDSELSGQAREALAKIEERIGLKRSIGPLSTASGRFEKPNLTALGSPPPIIEASQESHSAVNETTTGGGVDEFQQMTRARLIESALDAVDKVVEPRSYGYRVEVPLVNGRRQFVRVSYEHSDFENDRVIVVYTLCGPADSDYFAWALEMNRKLDHGKLAIGPDKEGQNSFWLMQTLVERSVTERDIRKAILTVAEKGDRIESLLTDTDVH